MSNIIRQPPATIELYAIGFDIYSNAGEVIQQNDPNHPDAGISRNTTNYRIRVALNNLNYFPMEYSIRGPKPCTVCEAIDDAYSLPYTEGLSWMHIPHCMRAMHIFKVVTQNNMYPLEYQDGDDQDDNN